MNLIDQKNDPQIFRNFFEKPPPRENPRSAPGKLPKFFYLNNVSCDLLGKQKLLQVSNYFNVVKIFLEIPYVVSYESQRLIMNHHSLNVLTKDLTLNIPIHKSPETLERTISCNRSQY